MKEVGREQLSERGEGEMSRWRRWWWWEEEERAPSMRPVPEYLFTAHIKIPSFSICQLSFSPELGVLGPSSPPDGHKNHPPQSMIECKVLKNNLHWDVLK